MRRCARPVCHGSWIPRSGRTVRRRGIMTRVSTFIAMLLPSILHSSIGSSHSSATSMDGGRPWALHVSAIVALLHRLPTHGGCFRECKRQGKWPVALRDASLAFDCCSSMTQSLPSSSKVSCLAVVCFTQVAAPGGRIPSTFAHADTGSGFPVSSISERANASPIIPELLIYFE